jgi:hypothetical protein
MMMERAGLGCSIQPCKPRGNRVLFQPNCSTPMAGYKIEVAKTVGFYLHSVNLLHTKPWMKK